MAIRFNQNIADKRGFTKKDWDEVSDNPPITKDAFTYFKTFSAVFPDMAENIKRGRGRPRVESPKAAVTLRLDPETVARFKAAGKDWRARMADALDAAKP